MKKIIKGLLQKFGMDLIHHRPHAPLDVFEYVLDSVARSTKDFYFVQVGANDGVRYDPLRNAIRSHQIRGLCIEPLPDIFLQLVANYSDSPQLQFENCAIAATRGTLDLYRYRADANVPDYAHGMATLDGDRLRSFSKRFGTQEDVVEKISVPTDTFSSVIAKHQIGNVSLLQIDTEGYDFEVLRLAFEAGLRPMMVHYEHQLLSIGDRILAEKLLAANGYGIIDETVDVLAMQLTSTRKW